MMKRWPRSFALLVAGLLLASPAHAYDAPVTQAGLVQKAALRSRLHRRLVDAMGRPLGLLEPIALRPDQLTVAQLRALMPRLEALDPAGGYRPGEDGRNSALGWLAAGAVIAEIPPERGRHHFLDPSTGEGLKDDPLLTGFAHSLRLAVDGGARLRHVATGTAFDLTGRPVLAWVNAPENDLSWPALLEHLQTAGSAQTPAARDAALARALMALGGVAAALIDMGDPAHVRNDFRVAHTNHSEIGPWDERPAYAQFVARTFGRSGLPEPGSGVERPNLLAYFTASDGQGLADRTHRRFFSDGTLPEDVYVTASSTTRQVVEAARASLTYPAPGVGALYLGRGGVRRHMLIDGRKALAYERLSDRVRFLLDDEVYADTARAVLPEIGAYVVGLIDHVLRVRVRLERAGDQLQVRLEGVSGALAEGKLEVHAEDERGQRRAITARLSLPTSGDARLTVALPAGASRLCAVVRGRDRGGAFVSLAELDAP